MKNEEKVALVERIRQYSGVKDVLLSEDGYLMVVRIVQAYN